MGPDVIEIEVERYIRDKDLYSEYVKEKFDHVKMLMDLFLR